MGTLPREAIIVDGRIRVLASELSFDAVRSSGPGGQNVNKVNSKIQMRWNLLFSPGIPPDVRERFLAAFGTRVTTEGEVVVMCDRHRDQAMNRAECVEKLQAMLMSVARPPKTRRPTKPTRGSVERRLAEKRRRKETKASRQRDY